MNFSKALAVITGGASGLGRAVAERVIAAGGKAAILDLQEAAGHAAAQEIGATFLKCDVAIEAQVTAAIDAARQALGGINVLVNCAGIAGSGKLLGKDGPMSGDFFEKVVRVNLIGTFLCDKSAAAIMQANVPNEDGERGVIIHTASVAAFEGQIGQVAYSATKAGIAGMTLPIARELARFGIRCVAIAPGIFMTPMLAGLPQDVQDSLGKQVPFPARLGKPAER
jgi:NAD(P)-dependent dehydrogenase (short-subunit alcohol dehydrogenase family)